ncbi:spinster family MFS transporter [Parahaliea aestuarii]|uniref:spinster family MFS transporter n=1 Tax=Parahaliea aestuarii TaxID=1852021 RepID=UPI00164F2636|nr:MFS transporter [Parahaliea aestuarii]
MASDTGAAAIAADQPLLPDAVADADPDNPAPPTRAYTRYVLLLIFLVTVFNTCDRTILSVMVDDIRLDLALSDRQMGFVMGLAFAVTYFLAGIPLARLADAWSRPKVVSLALFSWSLMTALGGLAQNFTQLALTRLGVGLGEAGASPPNQAMIAEYVAPERRARAMSLLTVGAIAGLAVGTVYGGWASAQWGWRFALISVGLPGVLLALLFVLTVRDYRQRDTEPGGDSLWRQLRQLAAIRPFVYLTLATCLISIPSMGRALWEPTFLRRVYGMGAAEAGGWYFVTSALPTVVGALLFGYLLDRLAQRDQRWYVWLPALSCLLLVPLTVGFYLYPVAPMLFGIMPQAFVLSIAASLVGACWSPAAMSLAVQLVPGHSRSVAAATWSMIASLVGTGLGPLLIGDLNARLAPVHGDEAVRYSLLVISAAPLLAALAYWQAGRQMSAYQ